ncbi:aminotransferase class III-fold pyridoxal phosphate-dependent enzyme [Patulibacter sp. NPDC049589]|uniref:aminotransferase class III-fold pyridoxal phosphate-dependent enzyme n=1 Tax=Patulibacter sp. NPDC049589 TaxID=3154731 RepID=UPI00341E5EC7
MSAVWPALVPLGDGLPDDRVAVGARGTRVAFADGRERLCGTSGLWNANLGHGHPRVTDAIVGAARTAGALPLFRYSHASAERVSAALVELVGPGSSHVVWTTSGGAANEVAVKLSRQAHALAGDDRRRIVVAFRGGYHGLTFGAAAHTGEDVLQRLYGIDQREVRFVDPVDPEPLVRLLRSHGDRVACVVAEPVLGSGTTPLSRGVEDALRAARAAGAHVIADEVATGFGRLGVDLGHRRWPVVPDLVLLSKGLTNGAVPGAAVVVSSGIATRFSDAGAVLVHAETGAGHPLATAAAEAVLETFVADDVVGRAAAAGARLGALLDDAVATLPCASGHVGRGLFRSLELTDDAGAPVGADVVGRAVQAGLDRGVVLHPAPHGLQLVPPLVSTDEELERLVAVAIAAADDAVRVPTGAAA